MPNRLISSWRELEVVFMDSSINPPLKKARVMSFPIEVD